MYKKSHNPDPLQQQLTVTIPSYPYDMRLVTDKITENKLWSVSVAQVWVTAHILVLNDMSEDVVVIKWWKF